MTAVSYTHLDVYKRQGERARAGENDAVRESVGGREFLVRAGGFWQVHREAPNTLFEAVRDAILALIDACLLYTSRCV